jgi:hypothetical protein
MSNLAVDKYIYIPGYLLSSPAHLSELTSALVSPLFPLSS